ncbi:30S ribosomal protein S12 methylthiotransferase RimO [Deltaproteobacteria bacterium Smac51]|nr:30S ribosomal protein S12 methylthiotransferase RimO [Deltaproteobacteria bacterium Smac51]
MKSVHLISLGCAKNLVDSERFLASASGNFNLKPTGSPEEADLIVINTCAFLQSAVEEALAAIMEAGAAKKSGAVMVVMGCLPSRYLGQEPGGLGELPEVDLWLTPADYPMFEKKVGAMLGLSGQPDCAFGADDLPLGGRTRGTPFFRAFLKIAEGCDNRCTYCLIPRLRGPLKSYGVDQLVAEAEALAADGVRELTLVAQDLTAYGLERGEDKALIPLVRRLSEISGLDWIRLLYAYPERLTERFVKDLAATPKVLPYLDLPFQHASADILKRMGRRKVRPLELVKNLRRWWPGLTLRTTMIVGFPGETEEHFNEMTAFVKEASFDHLGVFKFSPEEEAPASRYPNQVPQGVKEKRRRRIMSIQRKVSQSRNRARVGRTVPVLVEGPGGDSELVMTGRAPFQAPEVDGLIYFDGEQPQPGQIVSTRLIKAGPYDLVGRVEE